MSVIMGTSKLKKTFYLVAKTEFTYFGVEKFLCQQESEKRSRLRRLLEKAHAVHIIWLFRSRIYHKFESMPKTHLLDVP